MARRTFCDRCSTEIDSHSIVHVVIRHAHMSAGMKYELCGGCATVLRDAVSLESARAVDAVGQRSNQAV
jgi:uncharacterized Zn finger protein